MRRNHGTTKKRLIIAVAFLLAMIACTVASAEGEEAGSNLYGTFWSLLPPIIAIGCTGGQHRSVAIAEATARYLEGAQYHVSISHRDLSRANTKA